MNKTEIMITQDLLVINEQGGDDKLTLDIMLSVGHDGAHNYDIVFKYNGDWVYFEDTQQHNSEFVEEWMPGAIREVLDEIKHIGWLSDEIAEHEDWDYFREWADSAEATLANSLVDLADQVRGSENLESLCENLEKLEKALENNSENKKIEDYVDCTNLPTFGSKEPEDASWIFSYDETNYLVKGTGTPGDNWRVEEREDDEDME